MTAEDISTILYFYTLAAMILNIFVALRLEKLLKARTPATRPYRWGFYVGCMGVSFTPVALLIASGAVAAGLKNRWDVAGECVAYTAFLTINALSGWLVIRRRRWAWVVSTVFS